MELKAIIIFLVLFDAVSIASGMLSNVINQVIFIGFNLILLMLLAIQRNKQAKRSPGIPPLAGKTFYTFTGLESISRPTLSPSDIPERQEPKQEERIIATQDKTKEDKTKEKTIERLLPEIKNDIRSQGLSYEVNQSHEQGYLIEIHLPGGRLDDLSYGVLKSVFSKYGMKIDYGHGTAYKLH